MLIESKIYSEFKINNRAQHMAANYMVVVIYLMCASVPTVKCLFVHLRVQYACVCVIITGIEY